MTEVSPSVPSTARKAMDTVRTEHQRPCSAGLPSGSCSKCGIAVHVGEEGDGGVDADDFPASHCINGFRERNTAEQDSVRMQCCNCQMWDDNGQWSSAELQHRRRARLVTEHKPYVTRACGEGSRTSVLTTGHNLPLTRCFPIVAEHCRTRRACWGGARTLHAFQDRVQKEHSEAMMAFALALHPRSVPELCTVFATLSAALRSDCPDLAALASRLPRVPSK